MPQRTQEADDLRTKGAFRHAGHRRVRIEQAGKLASPRCRFDEDGC